MKTRLLLLLTAALLFNISSAQVGCMFIDSIQKFNEGSQNFANSLPNQTRLGTDVENMGDIDGDGIDDIAIGAHKDNTGGTDRGAVYIIFMNSNGSIKDYQKISDQEGNFQGTLSNGDSFGASLANFGDYNSDGINDLLVGAPFADGWDGRFWLLELDTNGTVKNTHNFTDSLNINHTDDNLASTLASIGDINGDGINDIAVGAKRNSSGGSETGAVHIVMMDTNYSVKSVKTLSNSSGGMNNQIQSGSFFGDGLSGIGDLNNDGVNDICVGARHDNSGATKAGAAYIIFLDTAGNAINHVKFSAGSGGNLTGLLSAQDRFGASIAGERDINGDGVNDIMIGAIRDDDGGTDKGALYCFYMNPNGTFKEYFKLSQLTPNFNLTLGSSDYFGRSSTFFGNSNTNNSMKIIVTANLDNTGGTDKGAFYFIELENYLPLEIIPSDTVICEGDSISLSATGYANYLWMGGVQNASWFYPTTTDTYSVYMMDPFGCSDTTDQIVKVNPAPVFTKIASLSFCENEGVQTLNHISPIGGTFTGTGISNQNQFNPSGIVGTHVLSYSYTDSLTCSNSVLDTVVVNANPSVQIQYVNPLCDNSFPISLSATPAGGTFSGPGVSGSVFNPSVAGSGNKVVSYAYTDANSCSDTSTITIQVNAAPSVNFPAPNALCEGSTASIALGATPSGGIYSGTGISGSTFNPTGLTTGTYPVTYVYQDANSCTDTNSANITINPTPSLAVGSAPSFCQNDTAQALTHITPTGGTYTGTGIVNSNYFNPQGLSGSITVTYTYTNSFSCSTSVQDVINVQTAPQVQLQTVAPLCDNDPVSQLSGTPLGGQFSGTGVAGAVFDPIAAGAGVHQVFYTFTNSIGCSGTDSISLTVQPTTPLSITNTTLVCNINGTAILNNISPQGGTFTGAGVSNNTFFATSAGSFPVQYTYTNPLGCTSNLMDTVIVNAGPNAQLNGIGDICAHDTSITLTASPVGGSFIGNTITNGIYTPGAGSFGNETIQYIAVDSVGCMDTATIAFTVDTVPQLKMSNDTTVCREATITLEAYGAIGILWNSGETSNTITVTEDFSTMHFVLGTTTYGICRVWDTINVTVNDPQPNLGHDFNAFVDSLVTVNAPIGYTYLWHDGTNNQAWNGTFSTSGVYPISVQITDSLGCTGKDTVNAVIRINSVGEVNPEWLKIYPNPAHRMVNISNNQNQQSELLLYDGKGALIDTFKMQAFENLELDVQAWERGVYFLSIGSGDEVIRKQIIIQ